MAKKLIDFYDMSHMMGPIIGLYHLVRNLNELYGYGDSTSDTTVFDDDRLTLEGVMTYFHLEHELLNINPISMHPTSSRIRALNELLAYAIFESLRGPICRKHTLLAQNIKERDVIWNLNYDLLADNALASSGKLTDSGYVMRFDYVFVDNEWLRPAYRESDVTLLKFHGSLNWLTCMTCGSNLLLRGLKFDPMLRSNIPDCPKCSSGKWDGLQRVIIPPSLAKNFGEIEVRYLWKYASSLRDVDRLVVIGFSFAEQDSEIEMLLRTMVERGNIESDVPIVIANPSPDKVFKRFRSIFDRSKIICKTPEEFF